MEWSLIYWLGVLTCFSICTYFIGRMQKSEFTFMQEIREIVELFFLHNKAFDGTLYLVLLFVLIVKFSNGDHPGNTELILCGGFIGLQGFLWGKKVGEEQAMANGKSVSKH